MTRRLRGAVVLLAVGVLGYGVWWLTRPVGTVVKEVGRSGTFAVVSDGEQLIQSLTVQKEFTGRVVLFADQPLRRGKLWIAVRNDLTGDSLVAPRAPKVRQAGDVVELGIALPRGAAGRTVGIEVTTRGVSREQPVRLWADERDAGGGESAQLFRASAEERPPRDARRPFALSFSLLTEQPRWKTISADQGRTLVQGGVFFTLGASLALLARVLARRAAPWSSGTRRWFAMTLMLLVLAVGAGVRWWFATEYALVNDEQSYIYNGVTQHIHQPYFWKSPVLIGLVALAHRLWPITDPLQPRLLIIAAGLFSTLLLAHVARTLVGSSAALGVLLVGFLAPGPAAHSTLVLTEQLVAVPILLGMIVVLRVRRDAPAPVLLLIIASVLLGLGVLTRWSAIFWYLPATLLLWTRHVREFLRRAASLGSVPVLLGLAALILIPEAGRGARILIELLQEFIERTKESVLQKIHRWRRIFGDFVPLLTLAGITPARRIFYDPLVGIVVVAGIAVSFFFPYLLGGWESPYPWVPALVGIVPVTIWMLSIGFSGGLRGRQTLEVCFFLVPPLLAYAVFPKANEKYAAEFLPGLVLLAGVGLGRVFEALWAERKAVVARGVLVTGLIVMLIAAWYPVFYARPYAGTLRLDAVRETVAAVRSITAPDDQVLAAAVLVPLFAERSLPGRLAHPSADQPTWRGRPNPGYHGHFGPIADMLERGEIAAVVTEKLFNDTYGRYPRIPPALEARYRLEREIDSGNGTPIRVYLRRAP